MRVWTLDAPSGAFSTANKYRLLIGIFPLTAPTQAQLDEKYLRRYLGDVETISTIGPTQSEASVSETADTTYLRRYLGDLV